MDNININDIQNMGYIYRNMKYMIDVIWYEIYEI